jgi:hypothetical protein
MQASLPAQQPTQPKIPEGPKPREHTEAKNAQNKTGPLPKPAMPPAAGAKDGLPHEPQPCCTEQRSEKPANGLEKLKEFTDAFSPWVLVAVGALGVVAALWTLGTMRQQARDNLVAINAARVSAEAATKGVDAVIASERAWIVVDSRHTPEVVDFIPGHSEFKALRIYLTNTGRMLARFAGSMRLNSKFAEIEALPAEPDFNPIYPEAPHLGDALSPNESRPFAFPIYPPELWKAANATGARTDKERLFVYASIPYYAFGDELVRELGICYMFNPKSPFIATGFVRLGPKGYNKQT